MPVSGKHRGRFEEAVAGEEGCDVQTETSHQKEIRCESTST
jgi:hypothetical protein